MSIQASVGDMIFAAIGGLLGGALVHYALMSTSSTAIAAADKHVVEAQALHLVSPEGQIKARLALRSLQYPVLDLTDSHCPSRMSIGMSEGVGQPYLIMFDTDCRRRATLDLIPTGLPQIVFRDESNVPRARLHLLNTGYPLLQFFDQQGKMLWASPQPE